MPAFWALLNNETETATTVHDLADKLDNGEILVQRSFQILYFAGSEINFQFITLVDQFRNPGTFQNREAVIDTFPDCGTSKRFGDYTGDPQGLPSSVTNGVQLPSGVN